MAYTFIVADLLQISSKQFYAPFAGAAIRRIFRDTGLSCPIVYDIFLNKLLLTAKFLIITRLRGVRRILVMCFIFTPLLERAAKSRQRWIAKNHDDLPDNLKPIVKGRRIVNSITNIETQAATFLHNSTNVISYYRWSDLLDRIYLTQVFVRLLT